MVKELRIGGWSGWRADMIGSTQYKEGQLYFQCVEKYTHY